MKKFAKQHQFYCNRSIKKDRSNTCLYKHESYYFTSPPFIRRGGKACIHARFDGVVTFCFLRKTHNSASLQGRILISSSPSLQGEGFRVGRVVVVYYKRRCRIKCGMTIKKINAILLFTWGCRYRTKKRRTLQCVSTN